jgi:pyruvate formate lyase activating enzyme
MSLDPIEKKPLYHFHPGESILSVGTFGCNMTCDFCQNNRLSQSFMTLKETSVDVLINSIDGLGIAFTYNEPTIWYEYIYDVSKALKARNSASKIVLVTNGFINKEPLEKLLPYVDAFNVDLKSLKDDFYTEVCGGKLEPVLESIKMMARKHLEVTTLMVTDHISVQMVVDISKFIASINPKIPLHLSRYFPSYKMTEEKTSSHVMTQAYEETKKILSYVFLGNIENQENNTYCMACKEMLIKRENHRIKVMVESSKCPHCGYESGIVIV